MQTVLQEAGPQSSGRGQSQGHDRGGLQETRAHKVRTRVCRQIKVKVGDAVRGHQRPNSQSVFFFFFFLSSFAQGSIAFFFVLFSVLLFTRDPKFVTGWSVFFKKGWETFSSLLISKKIKETKSLLTWTWTCPLFSGTSRTPSQVWSSSPCCSSSPRRNLPCAGGSTLKVSELNCTALKRN